MKLVKLEQSMHDYSYGEFKIRKHKEEVWGRYKSSNQIVWIAFRPKSYTKKQNRKLLSASTLKELQLKIQTNQQEEQK
jgi:hypothetical protein